MLSGISKDQGRCCILKLLIKAKKSQKKYKNTWDKKGQAKPGKELLPIA